MSLFPAREGDDQPWVLAAGASSQATPTAVPIVAGVQTARLIAPRAGRA